jgi:chlorobactene glucosyltransferase
MWSLIIACVWTGGVAWLLCRAVRQFGLYQTLQPAPTDYGDMPDLAVIVPARNEAPRIKRCLRGLLAQDYPKGRIRIIVVDDKSTDATAALVERIAEEDARVRLIRGQPPPPGWAGKPHACQQGADAAGTDWLCFLDADTAPQPALLRSAIRFAREKQVDLLSLEPFQELGSFAERLVIPSGMFLIAFTQDPSRVNDPAQPDATANGQFLLFRRAAYEAVGGFASARKEICEDKALALAVKRNGFRLAILGAEELLRVRMYTGFRSLAEGLAKNVIDMVGGVGPTLAAVVLALVLGWAPIVVPLGIGDRQPAALAIALAGSLALLGMHLAGARHFRIPFWYGFLFPLGYTLTAAVALYAVLRRMRGVVIWKGRAYSPAGKPLSS